MRTISKSRFLGGLATFGSKDHEAVSGIHARSWLDKPVPFERVEGPAEVALQALAEILHLLVRQVTVRMAACYSGWPINVVAKQP
jgi:hypothetical protein